jgi:hypothetical protein
MKKVFIPLFILLIVSTAGASFGDYYFFHSPVFLGSDILLLSFSVYSDAVPGWYKTGTLLINLRSGDLFMPGPLYGQVYPADTDGSFFIVSRYAVLELEIAEQPLIRVLYSLLPGDESEIGSFKSERSGTVLISVQGFDIFRQIVIDGKSGLVLEENMQPEGKRTAAPYVPLNTEKPYPLVENESFSYYILHDSLYRKALSGGESETVSPALVFGAQPEPPASVPAADKKSGKKTNAVQEPPVSVGYDRTLLRPDSDSLTEGRDFRALQDYVNGYFSKGEMPPDIPVSSETSENGTIVLRFQSPYLDYLVRKYSDGSEEVILPRIISYGP